MYESKIISISMILLINMMLFNCCKQEPANPSFVEIDTTFQVDQAIFPDAKFNDISIQSFGSLYRMLRFIEKAENGSVLKIGFIGGSITEGSVAGNEMNRYTNQFCRMLEQSFINSDFILINAGISATDSRFASSRVRHDLLIHHPDLIVIDFSVNESLYDSLFPMQTFEGLLRQCLQNESVPVIVINFTTLSWNTLNQTRQSLVSEHYSLPILSYQNAFKFLADQGKIDWNSLSYDDIHPNATGHFMAAYILQNFVTTVYKNRDNLDTVKRALPLPLTTDLYENAGIFSDRANDPCKLSYNRGWLIKKDNVSRYNLSSKSINDSIVIKTSTKELTICYSRFQEYSSQVVVYIDGIIQDTLGGYAPSNFPYMGLYKVYNQENTVPKVICLKNISNENFTIPYILYAN